MSLEGVECEAPKAPTNEAPRGWDLGRGVSFPVGVGFREGLYPSPRNCCTIHVEFTNFVAFYEEYDSLRLIKFIKLKF